MESDLRPGSVGESNYQRPSWWRLHLQTVLYISNKEVKIVAEKDRFTFCCRRLTFKRLVRDFLITNDNFHTVDKQCFFRRIV